MDSNFKSSDDSVMTNMKEEEQLEDPLTMLATVSSQHHCTNLDISNNLQVSKDISSIVSHCDPTEESVESILSKLPSDKPYVCAICLKGYDHPSHLQNHELTHTGHKPFQCDVCGKQFGTKAGLDYHKESHEEPSVFCHVCGKGFVSEKRLEEHAKCHAEEKSFICDICGNGFKAAQGLQAHFKLHSGNHNFGCDMCERKFPGRNALEAHRRTHTGEKPYICNACGMSFCTKGSLGSHYKTHQEEAPFKCTVCERGFKRRDGLEGHMKSHEPPGSFTCDVCGNVYTRLLGLKAHKRTHSKPKAQYTCDFCGKAFNRKDNLGIHRRLHTNEMEHRCSLCGRMFTHRCRLEKHMREGHCHSDRPDLPNKPAAPKRVNKSVGKGKNKRSTAPVKTESDTMNEMSAMPVSSDMTAWQQQVTQPTAAAGYNSLQSAGWLQYQPPPDQEPYQQSYSYPSEVYQPDSYSTQLVSHQTEEQIHHSEAVTPMVTTMTSDVVIPTTQDEAVLTVLSSQTQSMLNVESTVAVFANLHNDNIIMSTSSLKDTYPFGMGSHDALSLHPSGTSLPLPLHRIDTPAPIPSLAGGTVQPLINTERSKAASLAPISSMISTLPPPPPQTLFAPHVDYGLGTNQNEQNFPAQEVYQSALTLSSMQNTQTNITTAVSDIYSHPMPQNTPQQIPIATNDFPPPPNSDRVEQFNSHLVLQEEPRESDMQPGSSLISSLAAEIQSYPCTDCELVFNTGVQLAMHTRVHSTAFRPFRCDQCCKDFRSKSTLRMHEMTVHLLHGLKMLTCETCGKKFKLKRQLKEHQGCHLPEGAQLLPCEICNRTFKLRSYLKRHMKRVHGKHEKLLCAGNFRFIDMPEDMNMGDKKRDGIIVEKPVQQKTTQLSETPCPASSTPTSCSESTHLVADQKGVDKERQVPRSNDDTKFKAKVDEKTDEPSTDMCQQENSVDEEYIPVSLTSSEDDGNSLTKAVGRGGKVKHLRPLRKSKRRGAHMQRTPIKRSEEKCSISLKPETRNINDEKEDAGKQTISGNSEKKQSRKNQKSGTVIKSKEEVSVLCPLCHRPYSSHSRLRWHVKRIHSLQKCFVCKECKYVFKSGTELREHAVSHTCKKKFQCYICNASYKFQTNLHRHITGIHKVSADTVSLSYDDQRSSVEIGDKHVGSNNEQEKPNEKHVSNRVAKAQQLTSKVCQGSILPTNTNSNVSPKPGKCPKESDPTVLPNITSTTRLADQKPGTYVKPCTTIFSGCRINKNHYCKKCKLIFQSHFRFALHLKKVHSFSMGHLCLKCGNSFKSKKALNAHHWSHTQVQKRTCTDCGKMFVSLQVFTRHANRTHTRGHSNVRIKKESDDKEKSFIPGPLNTNKAGTICFSKSSKDKIVHKMKSVEPSGSFVSNDSVGNSSRMNKYNCKKCGKTFLSRQQVMKHVWTHTKGKKKLRLKEKHTLMDRKPTVHDKLAFLTSSMLRKQAAKLFRCPKCNLPFKTKYRLKAHVQVVHTMERKYKCEKCEKCFKLKRHLVEHMTTHQKMDGSIFCKVCKATFLAPHLLQRHMRRRHGEKRFLCPHPKCDKGFAEQGQLTQHLKTAKHVSGNKGRPNSPSAARENQSKVNPGVGTPLACRFCGKTSKCKTNLDDHEQTHLPPAFFCDICGRGFSVLHYLKRHQKRHKEQKCHLCDSNFTMWKDLRSHLTMVHGPSALNPAEGIDVVDANSCDNSETIDHEDKNTPVTSQKKEKNKPQQEYICEVCGALFKRRPAMQAHLLRHTGEKPHQCDECGATFRTRSTLRGHRVQHTGKYKYFCEVCKLGCTSKSRLVAHQRTHTGERPFTCTVCGMSFATKGILQGHFATHRDDMPFSCDICGRGFKRKDGLDGHKASHEVPGSFPCDICGKMYTRLNGMKQHRRTHTKPAVLHSCQVCGKSFNRRDNLNIHMKLHTNQLPFACHYCDKAFSHKCRLEKHIRNQHDNSIVNTAFHQVLVTPENVNSEQVNPYF